MTPERIKYFSKMTPEKILSLSAKDFTTSEIEELISETPMKDCDKRLAVYKFINDMTYDEIADKLQVDVKTVQRRRAKITLKMQLTCLKIFYKED